jgi:Insertion element 4 transposase N-terminal
VAIGVLTELVPRGLVDEVMETAGHRAERVQLLPARGVVYFVLAMCLSSVMDSKTSWPTCAAGTDALT